MLRKLILAAATIGVATGPVRGPVPVADRIAVAAGGSAASVM
ncbi:MAG TPA: hypothetical protein VNA69_00440 [Thermoanaerobaculia bacterium]|nr:hypothetical protein [Thermoanaerobaculia bacterium]